jgi:AraC-like DNA-binding protein
MKNCATDASTDERIFKKLEESPFFQTYREAFEAATGLPIALVRPQVDAESQSTCHGNSFCRKINAGKNGCAQCVATKTRLLRDASEKTGTLTCFAGFRESMVPVRFGDRSYAFLSVGEIFTSDPGKSVPTGLKDAFEEMGLEADGRRELTALWKKGRVMSREQYQGIVTLLAAFALQLAELLNRLVTEESNAEPEVVVKAKRFVNANLEEKISLESVASHVGVSPYYFCKVFKQAAGMTLTEYVNRRRVEWAKRLLLNPRSRVTEVAFDVGFQSISQFNRSFLKYVWESPTRYRETLEARSSLRSVQKEEDVVAA